MMNLSSQCPLAVKVTWAKKDTSGWQRAHERLPRTQRKPSDNTASSCAGRGVVGWNRPFLSPWSGSGRSCKIGGCGNGPLEKTGYRHVCQGQNLFSRWHGWGISARRLFLLLSWRTRLQTELGLQLWIFHYLLPCLLVKGSYIELHTFALSAGLHWCIANKFQGSLCCLYCRLLDELAFGSLLQDVGNWLNGVRQESLLSS